MAKILLVEDDNNLREIYEARLQAEGYDIVAANDGEQALVVAKNERPDLVISDVMMPKISGFEMLDILRNTDGLKDVKVIMLTALGQSEDKTRADQLGANKYLVKSQVTLEDIVKTTHQLLDEPEAETPALTLTPVANAAAPASEPVTVPLGPLAPVPAEPVAQSVPEAVVPAQPVTTASAPEPVVTATPFAPTPFAEPVIAEVPQPATPITASAAPTTLPDPASVDPRTDNDSANDPLTTAQETAVMEAKINDFVATPVAPESTPAEPESTTPPAPATPAPVPEIQAPVAASAATAEAAPVPPTVTNVEEGAPQNQQLATTQANDATMATAVDSLSSPTPANQRPSEVTAVEVPPSETPVAPAPASPPVTEPIAPAEVAQSDDSVTVAHKKIIKPIGNNDAKKDINQLLAEELAKTSPISNAPATETNTTPPVTSPVQNVEDVDPNSVAL